MESRLASRKPEGSIDQSWLCLAQNTISQTDSSSSLTDTLQRRSRKPLSFFDRSRNVSAWIVLFVMQGQMLLFQRTPPKTKSNYYARDRFSCTHTFVHVHTFECQKLYPQIVIILSQGIGSLDHLWILWNIIRARDQLSHENINSGLNLLLILTKFWVYLKKLN